MIHQYSLCEDCQILWGINEYSECPLCKQKKIRKQVINQIKEEVENDFEELR
jgi:hypothetical protein